MSFVKIFASSFGLFALAVGLTTSQANAQSIRGTFDLPFQAHWGDAVLEPGKYTISLPSEGSLARVMQVSGQGKTMMVLLGMSQKTDIGRSYLRIENVGQEHVVREITDGATGRLVRFSVPKSLRNEAAFERSALYTTIAATP